MSAPRVGVKSCCASCAFQDPVHFRTCWALLQLRRGRFFTLKHGNAIFHEYGTCGDKREWRDDPALFQRWKDGTTGMPLVDANMRELAATGRAQAGQKPRSLSSGFYAVDVCACWYRSR